MRIDIMTDIETLGTNSSSTIIQVSAIAFNILTGERISEFNQVADIERNEKPIQVTGGTIKWWLKTNKELFTDLMNRGEQSSEQVLRNFHEWLTSFEALTDAKNIYLWGNGILFDNKMIQHQLESLDLHYPIFYRNDRDMRTLVELASLKRGISVNELMNEHTDASLVAHDAFDDVQRQINLTVACYNEIIR